MKETILIKYIRNEHGHPIATVVATDAGHVGWSVCHRADTFDKELGIRIATGRANHAGVTNNYPTLNQNKETLPQAIREMYDRSIRYFK